MNRTSWAALVIAGAILFTWLATALLMIFLSQSVRLAGGSEFTYHVFYVGEMPCLMIENGGVTCDWSRWSEQPK